MLTGRMLPSLASALFFSFSYYTWTLAVVAEVYTLQASLIALIIYLWIRWDTGGDKRLIYAAAALWGLSLGNHITIGLLAPAFGYLVIRGLYKRTLNWRDVGMIAGLFAVGAVLIYSYLPLRYVTDAAPNIAGSYDGNGEFHRVDLTSGGGMWSMLSGRQYGGLFFAYDVPGFFQELGGYFKFLFGNFLAIGVVLGVVGLIRSTMIKPHPNHGTVLGVRPQRVVHRQLWRL